MKQFSAIVFFLLLGHALCVAEKVTFDTHFSVEFPEGWKKAESPDKKALVYRESAKGDASFAIAKLPVPKNAKANLKATLGAMIAGIKKNMKLIGEPKSTEGGVDGKKAVFSRVFVEAEGNKMGYFLVAIDCKDRVFILQATLPSTASDQSRNDCMKIIQSFKQEKK